MCDKQDVVGVWRTVVVDEDRAAQRLPVLAPSQLFSRLGKMVYLSFM